MEKNSTMVSGEQGTKRGRVSGTSVQKTSLKPDGINTDPVYMLRILTQAAYEIQESQECQEQGITAQFLAIEGGIAIVILGTQLSQERVLVPRREVQNEQQAGSRE